MSAPGADAAGPGGNVAGAGRLVLAATPLGNVHDATPRLVAALESADVVAAEDTRRLRSLAAALGVTVRGRVVSCYDAVETARLPGLLSAVRSGSVVLLVTDAGMPLVSDPGYRLVAAAVAAGLPVTCLPGPSAVTAALAVSGLPADRFCFEGFPPRTQGSRRRWLAGLREEPRTVVLFSSPRRLAGLLSEAAAVLGGERRAVVCRELTKAHEEIRRGSLASLAAWTATGPVLGEVTVLLAGAAPAAPPAAADLVPAVLARVSSGERLKDAVAAVAGEHGSVKRELYAAAVQYRGEDRS